MQNNVSKQSSSYWLTNLSLSDAIIPVTVFGLAWALHIPILLGVIMGLSSVFVYHGIRKILEAYFGKEQAHVENRFIPLDILPLREKALEAVKQIDALSSKDLSSSTFDIASQAHSVIDGFERTVDTVASIDKALDNLESSSEIRDNLARNKLELRTASGARKKSLQEVHKSLEDQLNIHERLRAMREEYSSNLYSSSVALESIVARIAELSIMSSSSGRVNVTNQRLSEAAESLDILRKGFEEAERYGKEIYGDFE